MKQFIKYFFFSITAILLFFAIFEGTLRIIGFEYSNTPMEMRFLKLKSQGAPFLNAFLLNKEEGIVRNKKDPYQLWVPVHPFAEGIKKQKQKGVIRIASLGDSCTLACLNPNKPRENYPHILGDVLREKFGKNVEVINAGVGGYTSYQGLQRFKRTVMPYQPDIVTIFFGWNDHWTSTVQDKDVVVRSDWKINLINVAENFRTYQFLNLLVSRSKDRFKRVPVKFRVSPEDYKKNINEMIDIAQRKNMKAYLITAPNNIKNFKPTYFFPYPPEKLLWIHRQYNAIVRDIAKKRKIPLIDLEVIFGAMKIQNAMSKDGIHFTSFGCQLVAEIISQKLINDGLVSL